MPVNYEILIKLDDDNSKPGIRPWKPGCHDVEISVIDSSFKHGHTSWGWAGENKLIISNNQISHEEWTKPLYDFYVRCAEALCKGLNNAQAT